MALLLLSGTSGGNDGLIRMLEHTTSRSQQMLNSRRRKCECGKKHPGTQMEAKEKWLSEVLTTYPHLFI